MSATFACDQPDDLDRGKELIELVRFEGQPTLLVRILSLPGGLYRFR
nr:hypothetical protein [Rhodopirellula sp. SM50]